MGQSKVKNFVVGQYINLEFTFHFPNPDDASKNELSNSSGRYVIDFPKEQAYPFKPCI